jgi:diguanylate cyclase (GGDEF)-like protein
VRVLLRRLDGEHGPLALVTLRRGTPPLALDALTGLPDRRAIAQRIESWRRVTSTSSPRFAVLFLDLDDFKRINDEHGHAAGDRVLELFAARLVECVREEDLVVRYGGDEFVLLLKSVASVDGAAPVVDRVKACACEAISFGDLKLQIGATIGVAIAEHAEQPIEDVIAAADRDMYARKRRRPK